MHELAVAESLLNIVENVDRRAPRTRSAAARQNPRPLGRGGFTLFMVFDVALPIPAWRISLLGTPSIQ
ncbi:MAG: hypothetical protein JSV60_07725, partial [Desulfobacterales bacterium]